MSVGVLKFARDYYFDYRAGKSMGKTNDQAYHDIPLEVAARSAGNRARSFAQRKLGKNPCGISLGGVDL